MQGIGYCQLRELLMRTGQFASKHHVSASTIGFYLKAGLLIPPLVGGKYDFGPNDDADMELILQLKDWGFDLDQIASILSERRLAKDSAQDHPPRLLSELERRRDGLRKQIRQLEESAESLTKVIHELRELPLQGPIEHASGVDVQFLSLFFCPLCGLQLSARIDSIAKGQFKAGELTCSCGYHAVISEGILENPALSSETPLMENPFAISDPSAELQNHLFRMHTCIFDMLNAAGLDRKVVVETHTGYSSFLLQKAKALPDSALYVCCDPLRSVLSEEKRRMDSLPHPLSVLFLATNHQKFPLRGQSAHFLISCLQGMFFTSPGSSFPFQRWLHYLAPEGRIIGAFLDLESAPATIRSFCATYPEALPELYRYGAFRRSLLDNGFTLESEQEIGSLSSSAFPWHRNGEQLTIHCYCARKRS